MKNDSIKKYLIPNIPYLFVLWAFLKLGTAYRLAAGADFAHKLMGLGQTIGPAFADFAPGLAPFDWLVGIVGAVAFRVMVYVKSKNAKKFRRDEEYGSARWGCPKDIAPFVDPKFENNIILTGTEFLTMNTRPKNPANARNLNACVIGSSGSGKTRFWLTPQILQASADKNGGCSYVCVDPKGGVLGQVGHFLQKRGYRIKVFNSIDFTKSMHYNPLAYIRNEADILKFVDALISNTTQTYNFLVALAFSQMFNLLCERADNVHGGRLPHHVRVLWDEAANTGQVPQLEKIVAVIRSREISLTLFYQQLAQCKAIYDKHAETILGNMDSVIFLGGREASTIKEISENWLGKATISMQTDSRSRGQSESYSQNNQRLGRELMTPSELATMPGDKCILQLRGLPPFYSPKYDLKKHPNYRYTAEADKKKNAFDLDRLINRKRRPGPDELCEVYAVAVPDDGLTSEDEDILNYDDIDDPDAFA